MYVNYINEPANGYEIRPGGHGRYPVRQNRNNWADRSVFYETLQNLASDFYNFFDGNVDLYRAQERNQQRSRTLARDEVTRMWNEVQKNIGAFQSLFGARNFIIVDNNQADDTYLNSVWKHVDKLVKQKVTNHIAKAWIENELAKKRR